MYGMVLINKSLRFGQSIGISKSFELEKQFDEYDYLQFVIILHLMIECL